MKYPKEQIIKSIREMAKHHRITKENIEKYGKNYKISMQPIRNTYGTLHAMKIELGYEILKKEYSKEEVVEKLLSFYAKNGSISKELLSKNNYINHKIIRRIWGNFKNMYTEIFPKIIEENRLISKSCLVALTVVSKELQEEPELEAGFDWLINPDTGKRLRIDALYKNNNIAIEFQGIQHYEFVKYFHKTMDVFEYKRSLDKIKKDLIIKNNIRYIEIPHYFSKEEIVALIRNNSSVS